MPVGRLPALTQGLVWVKVGMAPRTLSRSLEPRWPWAGLRQPSEAQATPFIKVTQGGPSRLPPAGPAAPNTRRAGMGLLLGQDGY